MPIMEEPVSDAPEPLGGRKAQKGQEEGKIAWDSVEAAEKVESIRKFNVEEKLLDQDKYNAKFVQVMQTGKDLTIEFFQEGKFVKPVHVVEKTDLDLQVPSFKDFGVAEVRAMVGSRRTVDVMDCQTQKNTTMTMKDWHRYFESKDRTNIYNVISLEFSNTKLESQVTSPRIVRQIDWIDKVWPRHLKELQIEPTNNLEDMMYPKVQKYCLMSVKKCYTDFHVDFGGTSVWYHIFQGKKIFWLIPPTEQNLKLYDEWVMSGKQNEIFFGDSVEQCAKFEFEAGSTLFIPSGWIHAVYTAEDSIVFGGNFLHSYAIEKQLQIAHLEEVTHVPSKFRFPFFTEMLWFVLDRYIHCLTGKTHLDLPEEEKRRIRLEKGENIDANQEVFKFGSDGNSAIVIPKEHVHVTRTELQGLRFIILYLFSLPGSKKNIPTMLPDPVGIVRDIKALVLAHKDDCEEKAITGRSILRWSENDELKKSRKSLSKGLKEAITSKQKTSGEHSVKPPPKKLVSGNRRRRVRCKNCQACVGDDCQKCVYCKDMIKYGGPGRMKQTCEKRRCLHPQLPVCAYCSICNLDGWYLEPRLQSKETDRPEKPPELYECTVCLDIVHPKCAEKTTGLGKLNEDLSNSWECGKCSNSNFNSPVAGKKRSLEAGSENLESRKRRNSKNFDDTSNHS